MNGWGPWGSQHSGCATAQSPKWNSAPLPLDLGASASGRIVGHASIHAPLKSLPGPESDAPSPTGKDRNRAGATRAREKEEGEEEAERSETEDAKNDTPDRSSEEQRAMRQSRDSHPRQKTFLRFVGFLAEGSCGCVALSYWDNSPESESLATAAYLDYPGLLPAEHASELFAMCASPKLLRPHSPTRGMAGPVAVVGGGNQRGHDQRGHDHHRREQASRRPSSVPFATKVIQLDDDDESLCSRRSVGNEVDILRAVAGHQFVAELLFAEEAQQTMYIGMQLCAGGDLFSLLSTETLAVPDVVFFAVEIALALQHVHDKHVVHGDLKPENVGISASGHVLLLDFGLAERLDPEKDRDPRTGRLLTATSTGSGTLPYSSPEVLARERRGFEADWWSYGVVLFEMLFRFVPWEHEEPCALARLICLGPLRAPPHDAAHAVAFNLVERLLEKAPAERISYDGGLAGMTTHRFFSQVDWDLASAVGYGRPCAQTRPSREFLTSSATCQTMRDDLRQRQDARDPVPVPVLAKNPTRPKTRNPHSYPHAPF